MSEVRVLRSKPVHFLAMQRDGSPECDREIAAWIDRMLEAGIAKHGAGWVLGRSDTGGRELRIGVGSGRMGRLVESGEFVLIDERGEVHSFAHRIGLEPSPENEIPDAWRDLPEAVSGDESPTTAA